MNTVLIITLCIILVNYISFPIPKPIQSIDKLPFSLNNPIDTLLIQLSNCINPLLYALRITPNTITLFSFLFILLSMKYLYHDNYAMFCVFYALSYWFDCIDGNYARTYGLTSNIGDWLDHITDITGFIGVIVIVCIKYTIPISYIILFVVTFFLLLWFTGCQEKYSNFEHSDSLQGLQSLCTGDPRTTLPYLRWFGFATFNIIILIMIYCLHKKK